MFFGEGLRILLMFWFEIRRIACLVLKVAEDAFFLLFRLISVLRAHRFFSFLIKLAVFALNFKQIPHYKSINSTFQRKNSHFFLILSFLNKILKKSGYIGWLTALLLIITFPLSLSECHGWMPGFSFKNIWKIVCINKAKRFAYFLHSHSGWG